MKFYPITLGPISSLLPQDDQDNLPGVLFERMANMEGLQREFAKVLLLPEKKKEKWITEHQDFIQDMLEKIRRESHLMIKEFAFDDVVRTTVTEYMVVVQQTLATLERVVYDTQEAIVD